LIFSPSANRSLTSSNTVCCMLMILIVQIDVARSLGQDA